MLQKSVVLLFTVIAVASAIRITDNQLLLAKSKNELPKIAPADITAAMNGNIVAQHKMLALLKLHIRKVKLERNNSLFKLDREMAKIKS